MRSIRWCDLQADNKLDQSIVIPRNGAGLLNCTSSHYYQDSVQTILFINGRDSSDLRRTIPGLLGTRREIIGDHFMTELVLVPWRPESERTLDLIIQCQVVYDDSSPYSSCLTKNVRLKYCEGTIHC